MRKVRCLEILLPHNKDLKAKLDRYTGLLVCESEPTFDERLRVKQRKDRYSITLTLRARADIEDCFLPPEGDSLYEDLKPHSLKPVLEEELRFLEQALKARLMNTTPDEKGLRRLAALALRKRCGGLLAAIRTVQTGKMRPPMEDASEAHN